MSTQAVRKAIERRDIAALRALLERRASPNPGAWDRFLHGDAPTPLVAAVDAGSSEMVTLLLDAGAEVNANLHWGTALMVACARGSADLAKVLLSHGAQVNLARPGRSTPLEAAAHGSHVEVVELLLSRGADPDPVLARGPDSLFLLRAPIIRCLLEASTRSYPEICAFLESKAVRP